MHELRPFGWDSDVDLAHLTKQHFCDLLARFIEGDANVSASVVRDWAEAIEGREDIGFEDGAEELLKKTVFELANPEINQPLTLASAKELLNQLRVDD
jgi:hypothetical protein